MDVGLLAAMPDRVGKELARRGIEVDDVAGLVDAGAGEAVLLTGSYATGEATPTSDLDLLVLTRRPGRVSRPAGAANHPSILGDSFDEQVRDLIVNVEYVPQQRVSELCRLVGTLRRDGGSVDLANLQALELRLIHRIGTGVVLSGGELVRQIRGGLDLPTVRASAAALGFVGALSLLADSTRLAPPDQQLMRRTAGESLLLSGVNAFGPITYDGRHLLARAARLASQPGMPRLFADRERLVFLDRLPQPAALGFALDAAEELFRSFRDDRCPGQLPAMLEPFRSRWAWSDRAFGPAPRATGTRERVA